MIFLSLVSLISRKCGYRTEANPQSQARNPQYSKSIGSSLYDSLNFRTAGGCGNEVGDCPGALLGGQLARPITLA